MFIFVVEQQQVANGEQTLTEQQRRRKAKLQNVQEDTSIDSAFAQQLDLSCVGRDRGESIRPPSIDNAYIVKYNRYVQ